MPKLKTNDIMTYYEISGEGIPLLLIHGGAVDHEMWKMQVEHFSPHYKVVTYDMRGHGETGSSEKDKYSIELFAEDLKALVDALSLENPIVCGLSMGGMIAQVYAVKYPNSLRALILADTAVSSSLTLKDKIYVYILAPKNLSLFMVRLLGMKRYTSFAFWFARVTRGQDWFGLNKAVLDYVRSRMEKYSVAEFNKIFAALYDFRLADLTKIKVPTLIINGEFESQLASSHNKKMTEMIVNTQKVVISKAGHTSNVENPSEFNEALERFCKDIGV